jgi:hypothetical protein
MTQNSRAVVGWISEASSTNSQLSKRASDGTARKQFFFEKKNQETFARYLSAPSDNFAPGTGKNFNTKHTKFTKSTKFFPTSNHRRPLQQRNNMPAALSLLLCDLRGFLFLRVLRVKNFLALCNERWNLAQDNPKAPSARINTMFA